MTFTGIAPGHASLLGLAWLARVGAAPAEALRTPSDGLCRGRVPGAISYLLSGLSSSP